MLSSYSSGEGVELHRGDHDSEPCQAEKVLRVIMRFLEDFIQQAGKAGNLSNTFLDTNFVFFSMFLLIL